MDAPLLYLFGYPGVGKNTIAQEIEKRSHLIGIQNHLISNAFRHVIAKQPKSDYARFEPLVKHHTMKAWLNFLEFVTAAIPAQGLIFTSVLYQNDPDRVEYFDFIRHWANEHNRPFYPVRLICSPDELKRRLQSTRRSPDFKLTDSAILDDILARYELLAPNDPNFLDLNTDNLDAEQSAEAILKHCRLL